MEITYRKNEEGKLEKTTTTQSMPQVKIEEWTSEFISQSKLRHAEKVIEENDRHDVALEALEEEIIALEALQTKADELGVV